MILLRDKKSKLIQGFSTILKSEIEVEIGAKKIKSKAIFSGDTILEKPYWGNPALGKAFLRYLWLEKVKAPFDPLYWFLISKGYKTYLLMANNFATHYPRFEQETPSDIQKIIIDFYKNRYGDEFLHDKFLIKMAENSCRLKENVAAITDQDRRHPRIAFF